MRTFVGFGFGPIQAGLFLAEAYLSHNFERLVVAEILPDVVAAVRMAGAFTVNIGHADHIEALTVQPVEIYRPQDIGERAILVAAVAAAAELATAVPSVDFYTAGGANSIASILAEGLRYKAVDAGPFAVVYAAENNTRAAELLKAAVLAEIPVGEHAAVLRRVQFLDTIIGKMSGAPAELSGLRPVAPTLARAFLVEAFNRILVTQIRRPGQDQAGIPREAGNREADSGASGVVDLAWADYRRGIEVFVEKPDLRPFAEAKLYGHNAGHALAAYVGHRLGFTRIDELAARPDLIAFVTAAMVEESGVPLCQRFAGVDPMFTPDGFRAFAQDLVTRMVSPYVRDTVARVGRDPARKVSWDDRLIGAMRLALAAGVIPHRYAVGAAAALDWLAVPFDTTTAYLQELWLPANPAPAQASAIAQLIVEARVWLANWSDAGFPALELSEPRT